MSSELKPFLANDLSNVRDSGKESENTVLCSHDPIDLLFNYFDRTFYSPFELYPRFTSRLIDTSRDIKSLNSIVDRVNLHENDKEYTYEIELPGLSKSEIYVEEKNGYLSVSGEKRLKQENNKNGYHFVGTTYGSFRRSFRLPKNSDSKNITAKYSDGVLTVSVPKNENTQDNTKKITVS